MPPLVPAPSDNGDGAHCDRNEPQPAATTSQWRLRSRWSWGDGGRYSGNFGAIRVHGCNEAVLSSRQRLNVARLIGRVVQGRPQAFHCRVLVVFEIDKRIRRPERFLQFL